MATRCTNKAEEVHHIRSTGEGDLNAIENAEAICKACHLNTDSHSKPKSGNKTSPPPFPQAVKDQAINNAKKICECTRENCHDEA
jgi:5-methylcytosine-specific restriction endonuclease McrA